MGALDEPLTKLVGDRTAKVLADSLKLRTVGDLLHHYPRRYVERGQLTSLDELEIDEHVTVLARIEKVTLIPFRGRKGDRLEVVVTDGRSRLSLVFFNQGWRQKELKGGAQGLFAGKVGVFNRTRQLVSPDYQLLDEDADAGAARQFAGRLIPVYGASSQMPSWKLSLCVETALTKHLSDVGEPLPPELRERHELIPLPEALELIHRPRSHADRERAQDRLRWDEAFVLQVALAQRRAADSALPAKPRRVREGGLLDAFDARLPFTLTEGQRKVSAEITADLAGEHPMHRLLQGEVGSGKTLVALRAMLTVVDAGGQAVLLAPTEVLAQQHHRSIVEMMGDLAEGGLLGGSDLGTRVVLLTGSMGVPARRQALLDMACGDAGLAIGTHALIEDKVQFQDLGLVVVDEQHRFGVEQRDALRAKGDQPPHLLVMTATPIPRTVAMTVFGDLETSVLDQLPAGRSPISTHVVPAVEKPNFLARAWERVREEVAKGHQAYVVCPRIGDEEPAGPEAGAKAAKKRRRAGDDLEDLTDDAPDEGAAADERRPPLSVVETAAMLAGARWPGCGWRSCTAV